jgi:hypothetical protein
MQARLFAFIKERMNPKTAGKPAGEVRLRKPEPQCVDDFKAPTHPVRTIAQVVEKLVLTAFCKGISHAQEKIVGRPIST